jgi:hypothetical protein
MIGRTTKWILSAGMVGALAGCGDSTTGGTDGGTPAMDRTYDYVVNSLSIDDSTSAMMPHTGFNLDGRFSPTAMRDRMPLDCDHGDFFSAIDSDQNGDAQGMPCMGGAAGCRGGVDNQLPELAGAAMMLINIRESIRTQVSSGALSLIVRVSGVSSLMNDSSVRVQIFQGRPMFPACTSIGMVNQPYALDSSSSTYNGGQGTSFMGSIVNGRLRVTPGGGGTFNLPLPPIMGRSISVPLSNAQIRVSLTENNGTNGNLGGAVNRTDILNALVAIPQAMMFRSVIESLINGLVDTATPVGGMGGSCEGMAGAIGMGLGLTMVKANVQATPVMGAQAGMCGSM